MLPKENDKRYPKDDKRLLLWFKRLFVDFVPLSFPGKIWNHIAGIIIYISFEILVSRTNGIHYGWLHYLPFYLVFILLFYFYAHIGYPMVKYFKNLKLLAFLILILCFTFSLVSLIAVNHINRYFLINELSFRTHPQTLINASWRSITLMIISSVYWFFMDMKQRNHKEIEMIKMKQEMERRELELRIAYENARINPHFLFNTLQFIYKEVEKVSPKAERSISDLAEMMRYSLAPLNADGKVPIDDEMRMVEIFINMARMRFGSNFYLNYDNEISKSNIELRIPPHIILTVVENMVKHGLLIDINKPATITIKYDGSLLSIITCNYKHSYTITGKHAMGIKNLLMRLEYFYPDKHQIAIQNHIDIYKLKITIRL
jgi:two-component system LytT family sensor kinase